MLEHQVLNYQKLQDSNEMFMLDKLKYHKETYIGLDKD